MANLNKIMVIGNLTREPEHKQLDSGKTVCSFGIAINRSYKDASGERKQETCFMTVDTWGPLSDICRQYLGKGDPVFVEGRLTQKQWQDKEGNNRTAVDITADNIQFLKQRGESCQPQEEEEEKTTAATYNLDV